MVKTLSLSLDARKSHGRGADCTQHTIKAYLKSHIPAIFDLSLLVRASLLVRGGARLPATFGYFVSFGLASGPIPPVDLMLIAAKGPSPPYGKRCPRIGRAAKTFFP